MPTISVLQHMFQLFQSVPENVQQFLCKCSAGPDLITRLPSAFLKRLKRSSIAMAAIGRGTCEPNPVLPKPRQRKTFYGSQHCLYGSTGLPWAWMPWLSHHLSWIQTVAPIPPHHRLELVRRSRASKASVSSSNSVPPQRRCRWRRRHCRCAPWRLGQSGKAGPQNP